MEIPPQLILLSIPSFIYLFVQKWRGQDWSEIFKRLGWRMGTRYNP